MTTECTAPYPRIYQPSVWARVAMVALASCLAVLSAVILIANIFLPAASPNETARVFLIAIGGSGLLAMIYGIASALRVATILFEDKVVRRDVFLSHALDRAEISGYRIIQGQSGFRTLDLTSKKRPRRTFTVYILRPDEFFDTWFEQFPDLDAQELESSWEAALTDPVFGETRAEREASLERFRRLAQLCHWAGLAVFFWSVAWPKPYEIAILAAAAAPVLAVTLVAFSQRRLTLADVGNSAYPSVFMLVWAGLCVTLRAMMDINFLSWGASVAPALLLGGVAFGITWLADPKCRGAAAAVILPIVILPWSWGVIAQADVLLDDAKPTAIALPVLKKSESSGRHRTYDLLVPAWGPRSRPEEVSVSRRLYEETEVGETVCVYVHDGALNIQWFHTARCKRRPAGTT